MKRWLSPLIILLCLSITTPALAGRVNMKKIKKWPDADKVLARSFDVWMTDDEVKVFEKLSTTEERKQFLEQAGYYRMWESIDEEIMPAVVEGKVVKGMTQDDVYMSWDKPVKIRKDFKKDAYVEILYYTFEIDRKGNEFLLVDGSQTAYKNDEVTYYVYMDNGRVFAVVEAGQEGNVLDELIDEKTKAKESRDAAKPVISEEDAPDWSAGDAGSEATQPAGDADAEPTEDEAAE